MAVALALHDDDIPGITSLDGLLGAIQGDLCKIGDVGEDDGLRRRDLRTGYLNPRQGAVGLENGVHRAFKCLGGNGGAGNGGDAVQGAVLALVLVGVAGLAGLGADALGLVVVHQLNAGNFAVAADAGHNLEVAAVALGLAGDDIASAVAGLVGVHNVIQTGGGNLLKILAVGKDHHTGGIRLGPLGGFDDRLGELVGPSQSPRNNKTNSRQHRCRYYKFLDCFHFTTPPKGFFLVRLSMCGVRMFINRMEKETPSG